MENENDNRRIHIGHQLEYWLKYKSKPSQYHTKSYITYQIYIKYWLKYKSQLRQYHTIRLAGEFLKSQRRVKQLPPSFLSRLLFCNIFVRENYCYTLWCWWFFRILVRSHIKRKSSQERCLLNYNHWHCNNHWSLGIW